MMPADTAVGDIPSTPSSQSSARIPTRIATKANVVRPSSRLPVSRRSIVTTLPLPPHVDSPPLGGCLSTVGVPQRGGDPVELAILGRRASSRSLTITMELRSETERRPWAPGYFTTRISFLLTNSSMP
jgi:hypothetical protein